MSCWAVRRFTFWTLIGTGAVWVVRWLLGLPSTPATNAGLVLWFLAAGLFTAAAYIVVRERCPGDGD